MRNLAVELFGSLNLNCLFLTYRKSFSCRNPIGSVCCFKNMGAYAGVTKTNLSREYTHIFCILTQSSG